MKKPGCTIIGTVVARPEKREELLKILSSFVTPTRTEPGCINYDFHCDAEDPNVFVFYENFVSQQALDKHLGMPYLQPLLDRADELLAKPVNIRYLTMLSELARA
ncbi:MAG: antibiotic biosynthesis monooxygenase [Alphaproteobacteria bacterium]|nr:antibiotic biosynthesis monooxygenase [Alphaproteobacteria bacterium]